MKRNLCTALIFTLLWVSAAAAAGIQGMQYAVYEMEGLGVLTLTAPGTTTLEGYMVNRNGQQMQFECTMNGPAGSGALLAGNRRVPVSILLEGNSLILNIQGATPMQLQRLRNGRSGRIFTPDKLRVIEQMISGQNTQPRRQSAARPSHGGRDSYIVGTWRGESVYRSRVTKYYSSSVFFYRFYADGTFAYSSKSASALQGRKSYSGGGGYHRTGYSHGGSDVDGGRWRLAGNKLILNWRDGNTSNRCYKGYQHEGKNMIKLGCNRKSASYLTRIR